MAELAVGWETGRHVVGIICPLIIRQVARNAVGGNAGLEAAAGVTALAVDAEVGAAELLAGDGAVIPGHGGPRGRTVTVLTLGAEGGPETVVLTADPVAVETGGGRAFDLAVPVAVGAGHRKVPPFERKKGVLVEGPRSGSEGSPDPVARGAVRPQGSLVRIIVTGDAVAVEAAELQGLASAGRVKGLETAVAVATGDGAVLAREELGILAVRVVGELEGLGAVAAFTTVAELSKVDVSMARNAGSLHALEADRGALA